MRTRANAHTMLRLCSWISIIVTNARIVQLRRSNDVSRKKALEKCRTRLCVHEVGLRIPCGKSACVCVQGQRRPRKPPIERGASTLAIVRGDKGQRMANDCVGTRVLASARHTVEACAVIWGR